MGLRADFIRLLSSSDVTLTDFTLFGVRINGQDYRRIAGAIRNNHIQIVRSARVVSTQAAYNRDWNGFLVGTQPTEALVVHEATHAINDWRGRRIDAWIDEGLAYVAQAIFVCRRLPDVQREALTGLTRRRANQMSNICGTHGRQCNMATIGFATIVGATLRAGRRPSAQLLADFETALKRDNFTLQATGTRVYNGITHRDVPLGFLLQVGGEVVTD